MRARANISTRGARADGGRRRHRMVIAFYQGFVDLSFLNTSVWTYMIRASGTLAMRTSSARSRVLDDWRGGVRAPSAASVVGGADVRGVDARHWQRVAVRFAHRPGGAYRQCCARAVEASALASDASLDAIDIRRVAMIGAPARSLLAVALVAVLQNASTHTVIAARLLDYIPFIGDKTSRRASTYCCGSATATGLRRSR